MAEKIEHQGVVQSVSRQGIRVLIVQNAACSTCAAGSSCMAAERKEKMIDALPLNDDIQVGDEVKVLIERRLGFKAVLLAFVLPFVLVILLVALLTRLTTLGDAWSGTIALSALIPYYAVIALFRDQIKKQFTFYAEKI